MQVAFKQVDVFSTGAFSGNPLAVIMDAQGLSDAQLAAIARWTNLSETTFVLPPQDATADYRVRIFTPGGRAAVCRTSHARHRACLAGSRLATENTG